jgi:hypothetical protein
MLKSSDSEIIGEIKDISLHGLFVLTPETLPVGTPVEMSIFLSNTPPRIVVHASGVVVRALEDGIGCTIEKIDAESFVHLRSIIEYQSEDDSRVMAEFMEYVKQRQPVDE